MNPLTPRIKMPSQARLGDIIEIKTKVRHPMETGWRKDGDGNAVPRNRINWFVCNFEGTEVFSAVFHSGVSADPYLVFYNRVSGAGTYTFEWHADDNSILVASVPIEIINI
jgi:sulfur-oxidizing protein SoxZ